MERWKHGKLQELSQNVKLFKQEPTNQSKAKNNQTGKPSVD